MKCLLGRRMIGAAALIVTLSTSALAQSTYDVNNLRVALEEKAKAVFQGSRIPGLNIAVLMPDNRWVRVSAGYRSLSPDEPIRLSDRMLAGSVGKMFFSAAILQQVQAGRLDLDAKISRYVGQEPWFAGLPNAQDLTLRSLMNHSSGIPEHVMERGFVEELKANPDKVWKHDELLKYTQGKTPVFAVGKGFSYADTNFIVAALVLEKVTGKDAYGQITERILRPMKLDTTSPSDERTLADLVTGYNMPNSPFGAPGANMADGKLMFNPQMEWAGGGFISTPLDLSRFVKLYFTGKLFSRGMVNEATTGIAANTGQNHKYGLGVQIRPTAWGESWGHSGWFPGYLTDVQYFPTQDVSIAVQVNTDDQRALGRNTHRLVQEIAEVVFGSAGLNIKPGG